MTEQERRDLLERMARGEDLCRLECICAQLGIQEEREDG